MFCRKLKVLLNLEAKTYLNTGTFDPYFCKTRSSVIAVSKKKMLKTLLAMYCGVHSALVQQQTMNIAYAFLQ